MLKIEMASKLDESPDASNYEIAGFTSKSTTNGTSRELADRHLDIVWQAQTFGQPHIAEAADELWSKHDIGLMVLQALLDDSIETVVRQ